MKMLDYRSITELEDLGRVRAFYTTIERSAWKYGKEGAYDNCVALADEFGISTGDMVMLNQTHTTGVRLVTAADGGEMVERPETITGNDGMVTAERGLMLCTVEADCVPVYLYDPVKEAIGMVHSGWKGTAGCISAGAVRLMEDGFGCRPSDIHVAIGPCICGKCYEVGAELKDSFADRFSEEEMEQFFTDHIISQAGEKYHLDLSRAIIISLTDAGILPENIFNTGICTRESEDLCSWRRDQPVMRSMLTGIILI